MIEKLRKKFIRIATIAVTAVLFLVCLTVNIANYISINSQLTKTLELIYENQGKIPPMQPRHDEEKPMDKEDKKKDKKPFDEKHDKFAPEFPYATRYFVLCYSDDRTLLKADLEKISSITAEDTEKYLEIAYNHGEGFGYTKNYKYYVVDNGDKNIAIFLYCYQETHSIIMLALLTLIAMTVCTLLVHIIVRLCSNRAIEPVVQSNKRQKQFITDASHELKTPITVIATSLKLLEMEVGEQKWIDKAKIQTEKLKNLVNSLVSLAKMDEEQPIDFNNFNVSEAVEETAMSFEDYAVSHGYNLKLYIEENVYHKANEYMIRQLVSILVDNAIKYADPNTEIFVGLKKTKKGFSIKTLNNAVVNSEDINKLFDRFYRTDKSRSSDGFGIGLSIAYSIVLAHKGSIKANIPENGKIEFIAVFP